MREVIRLVIADDTDIAREGMRRILAREPDIEIIGEAGTVHETIRKVNTLRPDVLLLDLKWFTDESAGVEMIERLTSEVSETKVVAITVYPHLVKAAKEAGALAALAKEVPKQQLIDEIRNVHRLPARSPAPPDDLTSEEALPIEELTERELEVLPLMAEGKTDKEIGEALFIAESTVKNHVSSILSKLNVPNRTRAVAVGYNLGILGDDTQ